MPRPKLEEHFRHAREEKLKEQDRYREKIVHTDEPAACKAMSEKIDSLGWKGVLEIMEGETYPPLQEHRKRFLGQEWDDTLTQRKLDRIRDCDLRSDLYFYNEIAEHTLRIKAMATFCERVGPLTPDSRAVYHLWTCRAVLNQLYREAEELDMAEEADFIDGLQTSWDAFSRLVVEGVVGENIGHTLQERREAAIKALERLVEAEHGKRRKV